MGLRASRKGQLFIVTMIFLVGLVFSVHSLLFRYSEIDLTEPLKRNDAYIIDNVRSMFQEALDSSSTCLEARSNVVDLRHTIGGAIKEGYEARVTGDVNCTSSGDWRASGPDLTLQVLIKKGETGESWASFRLNRGGSNLPMGTIVSVDPEAQSATAGSSVVVDIVVSDAIDLYGFQFDLAYDPSLLQFVSVTEGEFLSSDGSLTFWISPATTPGLLDNAAASRIGPVGGLDGSGMLAQVIFTASAPGSSPMSLQNVILADQNGNPRSHTVRGGTVNVI